MIRLELNRDNCGQPALRCGKPVDSGASGNDRLFSEVGNSSHIRGQGRSERRLYVTT